MEKEKKAVFKEIAFYIIIIVVVVIIKLFIFSPIRVKGSSMNPTLHSQDIMILDEISYRFGKIKRFDIVVIKYDNEYLIKRVIGLPGEEVSYQNNQLYINGKKVKEPFKHKKTEDFTSVKVAQNEYFVLGDNRTNSIDSRVLGSFKRKNIKGKTHLTIYPFSRFGKK